MPKDKKDFTAEQALAIAWTIKPLLPAVASMQGAVLAELAALWLAGFPPDVRPNAWETYAEIVAVLTKDHARGRDAKHKGRRKA